MAEVPTPAEIEPDDKDWTFVLTSGCPECGFEPSYDVTRTGERLRAAIPGYEAALLRPEASTRPSPEVWSPTEYAAHVRDVCVKFGERLRLMLSHEDPLFENWDQDATAVEDRYWEQAPGAVSAELAAEAVRSAAAFDSVTGAQWDRTGRRSNGSLFTVRTLAVYFLHDVEHHLHDVSCARGYAIVSPR